MELKIRLTPKKASEIKKAIEDEYKLHDEDVWGEAKVSVQENGEAVYEYTTASTAGHYSLEGDNIVFIGHRNSFMSGTALFAIEWEDAESWEILESQQPWRDPWSVGILNLTQHEGTDDQFRAGVVSLGSEHRPIYRLSKQGGVVNMGISEYREQLKELLTFTTLPTKDEVEQRAAKIAEFACDVGHYTQAMIGGAPYLMSALERALVEVGIQPLYAFSRRVSEEKEVDGKAVKTQVFKHMGFVEVREQNGKY